MLQLDNITAGYGRGDAIRGVSLRVDTGQLVALVGANGAGKSTVVRAALGLIPFRGRVVLDGADITTLPTHKRVEAGLVLVREGRHVFTELTVRENLLVATYPHRRRLTPAGRQRLFELVFELFPRLRERLHQVAGSLSGGEQQMLAIGRALMSQPKVLILDEPSLGLAPKLVEHLFEALLTLRKTGLPILLIEENANLALGVSEYGYVIEQGAITLFGSSAELLNNPRVRESYLGGSSNAQPSA